MCGGTIVQKQPGMTLDPPVSCRARPGRTMARATKGTRRAPGHAWAIRAANRDKAPALSVQVDRLAQLLEEALRDLLGLARQAADLAQQRLLVGVQVLRNHDLHDDELVAAAAGAHVRHAPAGQPERLTVL